MNRNSLILGLATCLALTVGCDRAQTDTAHSLAATPAATASAAPTATATPDQATPAQAAPVTTAEKAQINQALQQLYDGYAAKNLEGVLAILHDFTERSALLYAKQHPQDPQAAEKIRDAYLAFHQDIFNSSDYALDEFHSEFAEYTHTTPDTIEVTSQVPIISTASMSFEDNDGNTYLVRLRLGRFVFERDKSKSNATPQWRIVEMDLF